VTEYNPPVGAAPAERRGTPSRVVTLQLILDPQVAAPHVSYIETPDGGPDSVWALKVAEQLGVPMRARRLEPGTASQAPVYFYRSVADPQVADVRDSVATILAGFRPYPAMVIDRNWDLVAANSSFALLTADVTLELRTLPMNLLRLSLHPDGLASRIRNLPQWRFHVLRQLDEAARATDNHQLRELHAELSDYPGGQSYDPEPGVAKPLRIRSGHLELAFLSTVTALSGACAELRVEAFLPADKVTAKILRDLM
jgi:hypothetical protein